MKQTSTRNDLYGALHPDKHMSASELAAIAEKRLAFICSIVDILHTYEHDDGKLVMQIKLAMRLENLKKSGIMDFEMHSELLRQFDIRLCDSETELSCLVCHGFPARILRVMYSHKNMESIYVRIHRIKRKLIVKMSIKKVNPAPDAHPCNQLSI